MIALARGLGAPALAVLLAATAPIATPATAASPSRPSTAAPGAAPLYPELPNFHQVDERLFRGGQPGPGGIARLKALGVRTIVNLRREAEDVEAEAREAAEAGLRYFSIPIRGLGRPTDEQIDRVLALFNEPENWPVFVHCKAGSDRTGLVVACRRIAAAGWTAERAIREAMDHGMMKVEFSMRSFIRDFYAKVRAAGGAPPAGEGGGPVSPTSRAGPGR